MLYYKWDRSIYFYTVCVYFVSTDIYCVCTTVCGWVVVRVLLICLLLICTLYCITFPSIGGSVLFIFKRVK